jgi:hypothetical protein
VLADVGEEELEAVGGAGDGDSRRRRLVLLLLLLLVVDLIRRLRYDGHSDFGLTDLEPRALELARQLLDILLVELLLDGEGRDRDGIDEAALLSSLDDRADLIRLEQFLQLILSQSPPRPFNDRRISP